MEVVRSDVEYFEKLKKEIAEKVSEVIRTENVRDMQVLFAEILNFAAKLLTLSIGASTIIVGDMQEFIDAAFKTIRTQVDYEMSQLDDLSKKELNKSIFEKEV